MLKLTEPAKDGSALEGGGGGGRGAGGLCLKPPGVGGGPGGPGGPDARPLPLPVMLAGFFQSQIR